MHIQALSFLQLPSLLVAVLALAACDAPGDASLRVDHDLSRHGIAEVLVDPDAEGGCLLSTARATTAAASSFEEDGDGAGGLEIELDGERSTPLATGPATRPR